MQRKLRFIGACLLTGAALQGFTGYAANAAGKSVPASATLAQVIARNTQARGGPHALDQMHSLLMESEWLQKDGTKLDLRYAADRSGMIKVEAYANGKYAGSEGVDKNGVWIMTKKGPKPSVATGDANALTNGAEDKLI